MKSVTKSKISTEEIEQIIHKNFPGENVVRIEELTEGMFNTAYLVEGTGNLQQGVVIKIGPEPSTKILTYEQDILRTEVTVYNKLADKPIHTPDVLATDYSREIIPCDYFIMSRLEGQSWKKQQKKIPKDNMPSLMNELGKSFANIHTVQGEWFGYIKDNERFRFSNWADAFCAMVADILSDGMDNGKKLPYKEVETIVNKHKSLLLEIEKPLLVDFDLWAGNVFINNRNRYHITGIVDFERAFYGDPMADFVAAVMLFDDVTQEKDLQAGYSEISGKPFVVSKNDLIRMKLYSLYLSLIMFVETYRYDKLYAMGVEKYVFGKISKLIKELQ